MCGKSIKTKTKTKTPQREKKRKGELYETVTQFDDQRFNIQDFRRFVFLNQFPVIDKNL